MLELPHVLFGTAIATLVKQPTLSFPLALASHFALDAIPHWDPSLPKGNLLKSRRHYKIMPILLIDSSAALCLGTYTAWLALPNISQFFNIFFCAFFAVLPDLIGIPEILGHKSSPSFRYLLKFQDHFHKNAPLLPGIATQVVISLASILVIL